MADKQTLIDDLRDVLAHWDAFLGSVSEKSVSRPRRPGKWSVSDVIVHLRAWQQVSIAHLEAARRGMDPRFPAWLRGADPSYAEDHVDEFNARIREMQRSQPWSTRHREWREGFVHFLELAEAVPESVLFDPNRFTWLGGSALSEVLEGSRDHHQEHLDRVRSDAGPRTSHSRPRRAHRSTRSSAVIAKPHGRSGTPAIRDLTEAILAAWRTNHRVTVFLVRHVPTAVWAAPLPGAPRKTIRMLAGHLHNARHMWLETLGRPHGIPVPSPVDRRKVTRRQLIAALNGSSLGIEALLQLGCRSGGEVPASPAYVWRNLPLDVGHLLTYFVAHESHHRGQIVLVARQIGSPLPAAVTAGLWQWTKRAAE